MKIQFKNITCILFFLVSISVISSCRNKKYSVNSAVAKKQLWTCSMHPEIIRDKPGTCPICGMDLMRKEENATAIKNIELEDLLQPTDHFVISSIPVTVPTYNNQSIEVQALGTVAYDTRLVSTLSARIAGRIEKLYVKYRYQHVMSGERIMDIYSPELLTTQQELLFLLKNDAANISMINAAKQKLLLLGVGERQLQQIIHDQKPSSTIAVYSNTSGHIHEAGSMPSTNNAQTKMDVSATTEELSVKEGMYVQKGQPLFQLYNVDRSWVLLNILPGYQDIIKTGNTVSIVPETAPDQHFQGRIDFIEPFYRKENKTFSARVYFNNAQLEIPIGAQVRATIFTKSRTAGWLPADAVLSLGIHQVVFVKTIAGFKAQKVETGLRYHNQVEILSGVGTTDSVAANAQFLSDSESFIKIKKQP
ncbi:MAG: efflux RND transporter periplasmic adaptor subunit [Bacteroidota bacterium]